MQLGTIDDLERLYALHDSREDDQAWADFARGVEQLERQQKRWPVWVLEAALLLYAVAIASGVAWLAVKVVDWMAR